jgi:hypothetical protein
MTTTVVNRRKNSYDVYVGRPTKYGNPFQIGIDGDRDEVIEKFRTWIMQPEHKWLRNDARRELRGKRIACWCHPQQCHGDILAEIAESELE